MDDRERLRALLVERSVCLGDFALRSGARSPYYIDARRTTMSAEGQFLVGKLGWQLLCDRAPDVSHIGGLTMGADPVAYAIAHRSWQERRPVDAFSVRKQAKDHGMAQRIEGGLPEHACCVVVEDSMTTGKSALEAVAAVRAHGATVVAVLTVVDREEGAAALLAPERVPVLSLFTGLELLSAAAGSGVVNPASG